MNWDIPKDSWFYRGPGVGWGPIVCILLYVTSPLWLTLILMMFGVR